MKFCEKLRLLREERGMSLSEFAELLGTSKQVLSRYERGENTPKITTISHFAKVLNVTLAYLIKDSITDRTATTLANNKKNPPVKLTEGEKALLDLFRLVPEEKQQMVLDMIRVALKNQQ